MDKLGHMTTSYYSGVLGIKAYQWTGMSRKNAIWYFLGLVLFGTITFSLIFFKFDYLSTNYNPITLMSIPGAVMNFLRLRNEMGKLS